MEAEVSPWKVEGVKVQGTLRSVWKERSLSVRANIGVIDGREVLTVLYGCEAWAVDKKVCNRVDVLE